jgi:tRNA (Thr-GGU) A37 N-methylase
VKLNRAFADRLDGVIPDSEVILLTWLHAARRDVLKVHPQGRRQTPRQHFVRGGSKITVNPSDVIWAG